jgi:hypothetical protein
MPLYRFAVNNSHRHDDPEGTELPDDAAARAEARTIIRELKQNNGEPAGRVGPWRCRRATTKFGKYRLSGRNDHCTLRAPFVRPHVSKAQAAPGPQAPSYPVTAFVAGSNQYDSLKVNIRRTMNSPSAATLGQAPVAERPVALPPVWQWSRSMQKSPYYTVSISRNGEGWYWEIKAIEDRAILARGIADSAVFAKVAAIRAAAAIINRQMQPFPNRVLH